MLPKHEMRVRFPLLAPIQSKALFGGLFRPRPAETKMAITDGYVVFFADININVILEISC